MKDALYISFAVACIAFTVSETKLFADFRKWSARKNGFFGKLFTCGYCLGHWIAFGLTAVYRPRLFFAWAPLDYLLTALVIAWLAGLQWGLMCWFMKQAGK